MSTSPSVIRVLTVDDHALLREGIAALVNAEPDMELVAEASDGEEAIKQEELNIPRAELRHSAVSAASTFEQAERQVIIGALRAACGRIAGKGGAAERLGLKRTTLQNKMHKLNISRAEYSG
jgi:transcriptional regulator with GAF, ATPase, and Fis domain